MTAGISLTPTLEIKYSQSYDVRRAVTTNRHIVIRKKLHCWEGYFDWTIDGSNKGFSFRINIITIPDIKFERNRSGLSGTFFQ